MVLAIISDTHDNIPNLRVALEKIKERRIKTLIHCGDLISPFMFYELAKFNGEVHIVFGYGDLGTVTFLKMLEDKPENLHFYGDFGEMEISGKKIAFIHSNKIAANLAGYDAVFYGHTHVPKIEKRGKALLVNPGEILGWKGKPSFAVYDQEKNSAEIVEL